ncbi:MAG: ABC transporter permease [Burkholderiales bacterium]|jgi:putative ABC transport system permease protein|nr:FtsX-like permease family protein [Betaproteobacteria bacterium]NBT83986.1 FtsX-like permease family protein [Betaproteobacteria bacterium]
MLIFNLLLRNVWRQKGRAVLTFFGLLVATLAFGLLSTVVSAWYAGAEGASNARLITRNAISLVFPLPISHADRIRQVEGVSSLSWANWFGGIYKEPKNFFPQFAIQPESYLNAYPEYLLTETERTNFLKDRRAVVIGRKIANSYGLKVGDNLTLKGTIYPGDWEFQVAGIYEGRQTSTDTAQLFFHWDYLNEEAKRRNLPRAQNTTGVFIVQIAEPARAAEISLQVDSLFRNSAYETLTETEKAFQLGFVAMTEAIVVAIQIVSYVVILIIMAVMANTMAMTARERTGEYATLKALGFSPQFVAGLITAESLMLAVFGGIAGALITFPVARAFGDAMGTIFPVFEVASQTTWMQLILALVVGLVAAAIPAWRVSRIRIVEGLRAI